MLNLKKKNLKIYLDLKNINLGNPSIFTFPMFDIRFNRIPFELKFF